MSSCVPAGSLSLPAQSRKWRWSGWSDRARGIVLKDSPVELVFKCIRTVYAGEVWISRGMIADLVQALASSTDDEEPSITRDFGLTRREREILKLVLDAQTNKGIAERCTK
jgi:DNA-binding NarL/FixJ family response regulator